MELNNDNYYSVESNLHYMSATQFKDFLKCEKEGLAKAKGEYVEEPSKAMLVGSYVDAYYSGEMDTFKEKNPQIFKKDGTLLKDFEKANEIIDTINNDNMLLAYLSGKHQVIMVGEISGVPFKIKIDSLLDWAIVDQKIMASITDLIWVDQNGKNVKTDFVQAYGYDIQGAIYQEIVRQNLGVKLPFVLAVATKEDCPDKALIHINQYYLDKALELVKQNAPRFNAIKKGEIAPNSCGHCPTCRKDKKLDCVLSYEKLFNKVRENEND